MCHFERKQHSRRWKVIQLNSSRNNYACWYARYSKPSSTTSKGIRTTTFSLIKIVLDRPIYTKAVNHLFNSVSYKWTLLVLQQFERTPVIPCHPWFSGGLTELGRKSWARLFLNMSFKPIIWRHLLYSCTRNFSTKQRGDRIPILFPLNPEPNRPSRFEDV